MERNGAKVLVECLKKEGVKQIFGIPGAKIDPVFDALVDDGPPLIVCRHEQNAAFMAGAIGRLTGKPGVCLTTSGPGTSNLVTGLATANSEGDPVVAVSGAVPRNMKLKRTHQGLDSVALMKPVTKYSAEIDAAENIPEAVANAFRTSVSGRHGASFISIPYDVALERTSVEPLQPRKISLGSASPEAIEEAAALIKKAKLPCVLMGENASRIDVAPATRKWLAKIGIPIVGTFQSAGIVPREIAHCYIGRVGLFKNQPGDKLLNASDLVIAIGYDPIEYDPVVWNSKFDRNILHIDVRKAEIDRCYEPTIELVGDVGLTLDALSAKLSPRPEVLTDPRVVSLKKELETWHYRPMPEKGGRVHPLNLVIALREMLPGDATVICDVGSLYIWMGRHFLCHEPRHLLFSNGQQTLGVALPWAIAASIVRPKQKIISMSGDGGFLFSAMELETAVRLKSNFVHLVWRDGSYDMVKIQQILKYGRATGVEFGEPDIIGYAKSFGAAGFKITSKEEIVPVMKRALDTDGPVLIDVPVDYSDNIKLCRDLREEEHQ